MRDCPRCHERMMSRSFDGRLRSPANNKPVIVEMDTCSSCMGMWFDQFEAEATIGLRDELRTLGERATMPSGEEGLLCPACGISMAHAHILGIELDVCRSCQGAWFDDGELKSLNAAIKSNGLMLSANEGITCARCERTGLKRSDTYYDVYGTGLICGTCNEGNEVRATERRAAEAEAERRARWETPRRHETTNSVDIGDLFRVIADIVF